jgi:vibriolysin
MNDTRGEFMIIKNKSSLILISIGFSAAMSAGAADKVELRHYKEKDLPDKARATMLSPTSQFKKIRETADSSSGKTHTRYRQQVRGIPVWGHHVMVTQDGDGNVTGRHGTLVTDIERDIDFSKKVKASPQEWLRVKKNEFKAEKSAAKSPVFYNETAEEVIYIEPSSNQALRAVKVSFVADDPQGGRPSRPVYLIDALTGQTIDAYDSLTFAAATGPGGNLKIGKYYYGIQYPALNVAYDAATNTSTMINANVATINLNHRTTGTTPFSFTGTENLVEEINGGYSPLNDAQAFGDVVYRMYQDWIGGAPLTFQLKMRVHYSVNYENAFWDGSSMTFGDGAYYYHPFVALDVSAHEVSHGYTEQNSGLIYRYQSGGINESFSDMAGETAKYYMRGTNDFLVGYDIKKTQGAMRYMAEPTRDGYSIDHVANYKDRLDVHYTSGIYNKVFYTLATTLGWDTRKAFQVFARANAAYWEPTTDFYSGAVGTCLAARDFRYETADVEAAFAVVGINMTGCEVARQIVNRTGSLARGKKVTFGPYTVKPGSTVTVTTNVRSGDVDQTVTAGSSSCTSAHPGLAQEQCSLTIPADVTKLTITLTAKVKSTYQLIGVGP